MNVNSITVAPVQPAAAELNPKIRRLLEGPILPTLLKLTAPNLADAAARVTFLTLDAYFVSLLGSDALAGVALVFPFFLLMQTMATAAMGGGLSSAVARALGAGRQDGANALIWHGAAIALAMSVAFLIIFVFAGPALYSTMGAKGKVLEAAITYSQVVFCGGIFVWLMKHLRQCRARHRRDADLGQRNCHRRDRPCWLCAGPDPRPRRPAVARRGRRRHRRDRVLRGGEPLHSSSASLRATLWFNSLAQNSSGDCSRQF